jgi:hypothetical protein
MDSGCKHDKAIDMILTLQQETRADVKVIIREVASLKVKASIWGGLSGLLVAVGAIIVSMYSKNT